MTMQQDPCSSQRSAVSAAETAYNNAVAALSSVEGQISGYEFIVSARTSERRNLSAAVRQVRTFFNGCTTGESTTVSVSYGALSAAQPGLVASFSLLCQSDDRLNRLASQSIVTQLNALIARMVSDLASARSSISSLTSSRINAQRVVASASRTLDSRRAALAACDRTCPEGQLLRDGVCVNPCPDGQAYDEELGRCAPAPELRAVDCGQSTSGLPRVNPSTGARIYYVQREGGTLDGGPCAPDPVDTETGPQIRRGNQLGAAIYDADGTMVFSQGGIPGTTSVQTIGDDQGFGYVDIARGTIEYVRSVQIYRDAVGIELIPISDKDQRSIDIYGPRPLDLGFIPTSESDARQTLRNILKARAFPEPSAVISGPVTTALSALPFQYEVHDPLEIDGTAYRIDHINHKYRRGGIPLAVISLEPEN